MTAAECVPVRLLPAADFVREWGRQGQTIGTGTSAGVAASVATVIKRVRQSGQAALIDLTAELDGVRLESLSLDREQIASAARGCPPALREALAAAAERIGQFARDLAQGLGPRLAEMDAGRPFGRAEAWLPLERVGLYVPGGRAPYPSSVLMTALPARAAGVSELILCTPPTAGGSLHPAIAAAAQLAGVERVFLLGGAQAIAAMALGIGEVPRVDKIAGPGNAYVTEAKRQLAGICGFDGLAGPSEVVAVAGSPGFEGAAAAEMLAQAEHGPDSLPIGVILPGVDPSVIQSSILAGLATLPPASAAAARSSLANRGALLSAATEGEALQVVRTVRPEHLWLAASPPDRARQLALLMAPYAGAVYLGPDSPVAIGDYAAGPSHVLPTGGSARWGSPLGPSDFMRRVSLVELGGGEALAAAGIARAIAAAEGFAAHLASLRAANPAQAEG